MRFFRLLLSGFFLAVAVQASVPAFAAVEMPASGYLKGVTWLGHASFRIHRGDTTLYIDPWQISSEPHDADLVLITHSHYDHLDPAAVVRVSKAGTQIVTVQDCAEKLKALNPKASVRVVRPGDKLEVHGVKIQVVPAYNLNKNHHLKEQGWAGFVLEFNGVRYYHAGDTDFIPEMRDVQTDVAFLPVSGIYVMTADEAAEAARAINPRVAVPMHYGSIVGSRADAERFRERCGGIIVEILEKGRES